MTSADGEVPLASSPAAPTPVPPVSSSGGGNPNNSSWILSSLSSSTSAGPTAGSELDERVIVKAALDAAEDALESLCAVHAGTFVAVEKRGQRMEQALRDLETTIFSARKKVQLAQDLVWQAQSEEEVMNEEKEMDVSDHKKKKRVQSLAVLSEKHRVRRRTLLQHSALLELLELPSLMDACVRSNLYEEALSIASLANSLERRSGLDTKNTNKSEDNEKKTSTSNSNRVIGHVVAQIRNRQDDLRRHLLHRLQGSVTMPDCLEVVTALRRLNSIDLELSSNASQPEVFQDRLYRGMEVKLQIDFLEARDLWLDASATGSASTSTTASSTGSSSSEDLLDTIERYRTRVFEIATQFNAIFRANSTSAPSVTTSSTNDDMTSSADLLSLWACRRIRTFLQILQQGISVAAANADSSGMAANNAVGPGTSAGHRTQQQQQQLLAFGSANLRDLMEATVFFASSMGRLGADFTAHCIPDIFENSLVHWIVHHCWVQQGVKPLHEVWSVCQQVNVATPLVTGSGSSSSGATMSGRSSGTAIVVWSNPSAEEVEQLFRDFVVPENPDVLLEQPLGPPRVLMQVPPLGRFVNAILLGFNELRRCLLPSALPRLEQSLEDEVLAVVTQELKQMERHLITTTPATTSGHQKDNRKMLREVISLEYVPLWNNIVMPYCRGSFWTAIGRGSLALKEYQSARQAMDKLIQEKKDDSAAIMEKQKRESPKMEKDNEEEVEGEETVDDVEDTNAAAEKDEGDSVAAGEFENGTNDETQ